MKTKIISLALGTTLGLLAGQEHWHAQNQNTIPTTETEYCYAEEPVHEHFAPLIGTDPPEGQTRSLRSDTLLYYDEDIPFDVQEAAEIYGEEYNICPEFLEAIAYAESRYIPTVSNGSCVGLMQINVGCQGQLERMERLGFSSDDMYEVDASMLVSADYLRELFDEYEDPAEVLMRYNGDQTGLKKFKKTGEISKYAEKVLEHSEELERKHGK